MVSSLFLFDITTQCDEWKTWRETSLSYQQATQHLTNDLVLDNRIVHLKWGSYCCSKWRINPHITVWNTSKTTNMTGQHIQLLTIWTFLKKPRVQSWHERDQFNISRNYTHWLSDGEKINTHQMFSWSVRSYRLQLVGLRPEVSCCTCQICTKAKCN